MPIALAGGIRATILSIVGLELLPFFSTPEACSLRLVCREFVGAIAQTLCTWLACTRCTWASVCRSQTPPLCI